VAGERKALEKEKRWRKGGAREKKAPEKHIGKEGAIWGSREPKRIPSMCPSDPA